MWMLQRLLIANIWPSPGSINKQRTLLNTSSTYLITFILVPKLFVRRAECPIKARLQIWLWGMKKLFRTEKCLEFSAKIFKTNILRWKTGENGSLSFLALSPGLGEYFVKLVMANTLNLQVKREALKKTTKFNLTYCFFLVFSCQLQPPPWSPDLGADS